MKRFKSFNEAVEVDDISVGKKKKKPAGVKADEPLKGYAYNEKTKEMSLDDIKKKYAKEIIAFQDGGKDLSSGAKMALYGYIGSDGLKTDDADEFDDFVMGLQMGKYKKTEEQVSMDILLNMLEETNLNEALSPKEKEKRLLMIKKAVQKLNRANIEKAKKMAMRDMKASGMFDDVLDEHIKGGADSYAALQNAKAKAKKMGKVWKQMGEPEKNKLIDVEMKAAGYEKKPGNQMYTKIPTEREKERADKMQAKDKEVSKMSDADKVDYFSKNPTQSTGGHNVSDEGKKKIQIAKYQSQIDALEKRAIAAQQKAYEADEKGDDLAFEKYQDEEEYYLERIREVENHLEDLKAKE